MGDCERGPVDSDDPNYRIHFMHDLEVIAEPIQAPTNAGLAFYGKRKDRKAG